jgi:colanic acid biosynthesis glycosyl transferase WcaI
VPPTGSAAQTVTKSRGGIVVEPENAEALAASILDLYHNPIKTELLGQQGRQFAVERFSFEQALNQYESLFDEVTDKMQLLQTTAALQAKKSAANI